MFGEEIRIEAINYAKENRGKICGLTSSFVGRVLLMIRQAENFDDLMSRIRSIKTDSKRKTTDEVVQTAEQYESTGMWREYLEIIFLLGKYFLRRELSDETHILQDCF